MTRILVCPTSSQSVHSESPLYQQIDEDLHSGAWILSIQEEEILNPDEIKKSLEDKEINHEKASEDFDKIVNDNTRGKRSKWIELAKEIKCTTLKHNDKIDQMREKVRIYIETLRETHTQRQSNQEVIHKKVILAKRDIITN